jgi:hypothetical protein
MLRVLILLSDYMGNNLYWCNGERGTVEVMSLTVLENIVFIHSSDWEFPLDVAVVPEEV